MKREQADSAFTHVPISCLTVWVEGYPSLEEHGGMETTAWTRRRPDCALMHTNQAKLMHHGLMHRVQAVPAPDCLVTTAKRSLLSPVQDEAWLRNKASNRLGSGRTCACHGMEEQ